MEKIKHDVGEAEARYEGECWRFGETGGEG